MFNGEFLESQQQAATLEETEDVVSVRSLETLFQWLYQRVVIFEIEDPGERISAAMELARLADKYDINGLEDTNAQYIKDILISNPHPKNKNSWRSVDSNTYFLKYEHIVSATQLPQKHPVRSVLAAASVEGYLRSRVHKVHEETQAYPSFGADLLREMTSTLHKVQPLKQVTFEDPISGTTSTVSSELFFWD